MGEERMNEMNNEELEKISGGPEERTVLGLAAAADCRKCKNCGKIFDDGAFEFCPVCNEKLS